ncbi:class II glutamine amidotransferase [Candidatus Woesearchaeota archaeon]|nr:class II glutamine amidotransferase [Candidatus Woesearchaeota archaeon]
MCRMLLAIGNVQLPTVVDAIKHMALDQTFLHERNEKTGLGSRQHKDGWGIAFIDNKNNLFIHRSTDAIFNDPLISSLPSKTTFALLHTRAASVGNVCLENTHPFYYKDKTGTEHVFCHNGTIREDIGYNPELKLQGTTDSEKIFFSIISQIQKDEKKGNKDYRTALQKALNQLPTERDSNFIFSTKKSSYITSSWTKYPRYLQMWIGRGKDLLIISSEKIESLSDLNWKPITKNSIIEVNHLTLQSTITLL